MLIVLFKVQSYLILPLLPSHIGGDLSLRYKTYLKSGHVVSCSLAMKYPFDIKRYYFQTLKRTLSAPGAPG